jgi:hypothetical protein
MNKYGITTVTPVLRRRTRNQNGTSFQYEYVGTKAEMEALDLTLAANVASVSTTEIIYGQGAVKLVANYDVDPDNPPSSPEDVQTEIIEVDFIELRKDLRNAPYYDIGDAGLEKGISQIEADIRDNKEFWNIDYSDFHAKANDYRDDRASGIESIVQGRPIIRRTLYSPNSQTLTLSYSNVDQVSAPPSIPGVSGSLPSGQWLKRPPRFQRTGKQVILTQEWHWAESWAARHYT